MRNGLIALVRRISLDKHKEHKERECLFLETNFALGYAGVTYSEVTNISKAG